MKSIIDLNDTLQTINMQVEKPKTRRLPAEYKEVQWISSDGSQYINMGDFNFKTPNAIDVETKFSLDTDSTNDNCVMGGRMDSGDRNGFKLPLCYGGKYSVQGISGKLSIGTTSPYTPVVFAAKIYNGDQSFKIDGTEIYKGNSAYDTLYCGTDRPLYMFAFRYNYNKSYAFHGKIYYSKIWDTGELIRDYVPCYRKSDNVIGMYDLVNDVFYTNRGTGTFTKGPEID